MPDIFGKNPSDYRMIQDLAKKGFLTHTNNILK